MVRAFRFALRSCVLLSGLALCVAGAYAEQSTRAARLVSVEGATQIFGAGESKDQAGDVQANMPLLEGTQLRTAEDGRAEIEFEDGSIARVTPNSQVSLDSLGEKETVIGVAQGLAYFELREDSAHPYSVRYGSSVVRLVSDSTFRVNVDVAPGELAVSAGEVVVANGDQKVVVRAGESLRSDEEGSTPSVAGITPDSWDEWNDDKDAQAAAAHAQQSEVASQQPNGSSYGWSDLDAYGDWYPLEDGAVWQPADAGADFNPYTYGSWAWYPGFGYTWVSGYAWGWTPFHCGGWSYFDGFGWGWRPGSCYGWGTGLHYRRPPPGFRPPVKPIGPPTVIRRHPVLPRKPAQPVVTTSTTLLPTHKTAPVILDGAVVLPLPRKSTVIHQTVGEGLGEGSDSPVLGNRSVVTRGAYAPTQTTRSTFAPVTGAPVRVSPPVRMNPPVVARPMPMPSTVHSSPSPVAPPSAPHVASPPAASHATAPPAAAVHNR